MSEENKNTFNENENYSEQPIINQPVSEQHSETNNYNTQNPSYNTGYFSSDEQKKQRSAGIYSYPANQQYNYSNYQPTIPDTNKKSKKEKKKGSFKLVFSCILLSLICGFSGAFGGMFLYEKYSKNEPNESVSNKYTVIYETVDKELPETVIKAGTVATVAKVALPSVVEIKTEAVVNNSFYGQYVTEGAGSGVVISADGYIATNNHVISGASNITVRLYDGKEYKAKLIGTDSQTDVAVIKIEAENLTPAVYGDSSKLTVGELTVAIGNPLGNLGGTVTDGIVSALDREITVEGEKMVLLQTNAAVNPGNSGGGLFNANGELIGIVNAKSSGESVEGLGFAIPINTAKTIIEDLIENGHVTGRPSIGVSVIEITTDYQKYTYGVRDYGVYIQNSLNADFKAGDRIIAIDGNSVSTFSDIRSIINSYKVGDEITVTVFRNNKIVDVEVTLIDSAENTLNTDPQKK